MKTPLLVAGIAVPAIVSGVTFRKRQSAKRAAHEEANRSFARRLLASKGTTK
jgi:hypothetical protein